MVSVEQRVGMRSPKAEVSPRCVVEHRRGPVAYALVIGAGRLHHGAEQIEVVCHGRCRADAVGPSP